MHMDNLQNEREVRKQAVRKDDRRETKRCWKKRQSERDGCGTKKYNALTNTTNYKSKISREKS